MKKLYVCFLFIFSFYTGKAFSLSVSLENANKIGEKIWKNECAGSFERLTNWNQGENFASLGIGHFIWYCDTKREKFQETFPDLLLYIEKNGVTLPAFLKTAKGCPWSCREEFYKNFKSAQMIALRQFLLDTKQLQAMFIAKKLETSFDQILTKCQEKERNKIVNIFNLLASDGDGLYALIDYLNFKGSGISLDETYNQKGWGLLQVLENMKEDSNEAPLVSFVNSAKIILNERVKNSPPERNEERWIKGWHNRLDTYINK